MRLVHLLVLRAGYIPYVPQELRLLGLAGAVNAIVLGYLSPLEPQRGCDPCPNTGAYVRYADFRFCFFLFEVHDVLRLDYVGAQYIPI